MIVEEIPISNVLQLGRTTLALPVAGQAAIDEVFLGALVRRAASILCPCSSRTIAQAVLEGLGHLVAGETEIADDIDAAVEGAMIAGDLLELGQVTTDDPNSKGTWVFAAPPAFVALPSGSVFVTGIAGEEASPLPAALTARIIYDRHFRVIHPQASENLSETLRELGLFQLSDRNWLRLPKEETAAAFQERIERQLAAQSPGGQVADLLLLDSARDPKFYKGRWTPAKKQTGYFVARRPQAYGAPIWGFADLADGAVSKFLDFPPKKDKWRGSDFAWHLQLAIDACRGSPQQYRRRSTPHGTCLDFFSPLPLWAERRLAIIGRPADRHHCLFSYAVPERELPEEEAFLQRRVWLTRDQSPEGN